MHRTPAFLGVPLKTISLAVLTVENSALILVMHYSRVMPLVGGQRYLASTAVFMNEVVKLAISLTLALYEQSNAPYPDTSAMALVGNVLGNVFSGDSWKMAIPAALYTLQNSLQYIAVSNLDAATYQVTDQLKILSVALFSVLMLGRQLSMTKWLSLGLLMLGVAIVQVPSGTHTLPTLRELKDGSTGWSLPRTVEEMRDLGNLAAAQLLVKRSATYEGIEKLEGPLAQQLSATRGLVAALLGCVTSGLAGVRFEKILKDSATDVSLWVRNVQMSFYSLFPALFIGVMFRDGVEISRSGFFAGYTWVVWSVVLLQAVGGLLVSAVVSYANNIAKGFATSLSIVLSVMVGIVFFNTEVRVSLLTGTLIVLVATYLYNRPDSRPKLPSLTVVDYAADKKQQEANEQSYFNLESARDSATSAVSPAVRGDALSSSRPVTPSYERRTLRSKTSQEYRQRDS